MTVSLEEISSAAKLVTLPDLYIRLRAVLNDPDYSMRDVAEVIAHDPGTTARLLKLVNSAFFGLPAKIETVPRAVGLLGSQQIHDLVLASSVTQTFSGMSTDIIDMQTYWHRSVYCAVASRLIAAKCNVLDSERLFVAGLLRDIGHLILYQRLPELAQQSIEQAEEEERPLFRVERELIGFDYASVGGMLLHQWNLPNSLRVPVEYHVEPVRANEYVLETAIVHLAGFMAEAALMLEPLETLEQWVMPAVWQIINLRLEQCGAIQQEAQDQVREVENLILPQFSVAIGA